MEQENKMGVLPVKKLLFTMSVPMMLSMLVQALYNVVDSIYVSHLSDYALTAVSLSFPIQNLMIAIASGTAVGVNALLSKSLGEKNFETANKTANTSLFLAGISSVIFIIFGLFFSRAFFVTQTDIPEIVQGGYEYLSICTIFSFGIFGQIMCERLLQSTGRTIFSMITQTTGAIINIILDPILIFGMFGLPAMGVAGAAAATVAGQIVGLFMGIFFNIKFNKDIKLKLSQIRPHVDIVKKIYIVGLPSIVMMSIGSVMTFLLNKILFQFTYIATTVFGVYMKLQSFIFMPVFGLTNGLIPIVAYNYGAKNRARITEAYKTGLVTAIIMMLCGTILFNAIPQVLLGFFEASDQMLEIGVPALRIISLCFIFAAYGISCGSIFQALGNGVYSLIVSFTRQILFLVPAAFLLSLTGKLNLVWLAFPLAEFSAVILSTYFLKRIFKQKLTF